MAGKKKKKPAANPARGFMTVSLPSKPKEPGIPDVETQPNAQTAETRCTQTTAGNANDTGSVIQSGNVAQNTNDMTPEQYEAHLERTWLENIVESHAARIKAGASRQVTKLLNERRQLRQAADPASVPGLTEELMDEILDDGFSCQNCVVVSDKTDKESGSDDDEKLLRLWTLDRVLAQLKMSDIDDALAHVANQWHKQGWPAPDDYIVGLTACLKWYALNKESRELPDYDTGNIFIHRVVESKPSSTLTVLSEVETPGTEKAGDRNGTSNTTDSTATDGTLEDNNEEVSDPEDLDDEVLDNDDDDPEKLVSRWLRLQMLNFKLNQKTTGSTGLSTRKKDVEGMIRLIEKDMLFDADEAHREWQQILRDLQIEVGRARKKFRGKPNSEKRSAENEAPRENSDSDSMLGGMFGEEVCADESDQTLDESKPVTIHDFGIWSGVHPRRLLEEAASELICRNGLKFHALLNTSFSSRLHLDVYWEAEVPLDHLYRSYLPAGITLQQGNMCWTVKMEFFATRSAVQSEALLSTLVLFFLSSVDRINTKIIQRLPKVWRDQFSDFSNLRSEAVANEDLQRLTKLRDIFRQGQSSASIQASEQPEPRMREAIPARQARNFFVRQTPEAALKSWMQRANTPAFRKMQAFRQDLPVYKYKQDILTAFEANQFLIICADTGAGKSTQVPSYVLESQLTAGKDFNIMVTQPRRISAISIARRVSAELGEPESALGTSRSLVGYAIRLESKTSPSTRITFATTGVLLRVLQESANLDHLDCLILDEVHERTMDLDLLFIALKRLRERRPTLKIVLMSATVDATKFSQYFDGASVLNIPGRTFPVQVSFLEDVLENVLALPSRNDSTPDSEPPSVNPSDSDDQSSTHLASAGLDSYSPEVRRAIARYNYSRIDYDLIVKLAAAIATEPRYVPFSNAVLIFMPGIGEIRRLYNLMMSSPTFSSGWAIHMLHSSFSTQELERAFLVPPAGHRKIVIATNIAETGITIPDITAVIDTCKEKVMRFDERRQLSRLTEGLISRASARQRKGRAARVQDGLCFHLVTRQHYEQKMPEQATPEMLRLSLQDPILRVKVWKLGLVEEVLSAAIDPPSIKNIRRAVAKLQEVGALDRNEKLTPLGKTLAKLPLDVAMGKMAVFGTIFQCLDAVVTIIASFAVKSVFIDKGEASPSSQASFARADSDFMTTYNAYAGWKKAVQAGTGQQFCHKYHLSHFQLQQIEEQKVQLLVYLEEAELIALTSEEHDALHGARHSKSSFSTFEVPDRFDVQMHDATIAAAIAVALYPNILKREGQGYRNVYTNQHLQLAATSINRLNRPPEWLAYLEAIQAKTGKLNAFHSSRITQAMLALIFGEADFRFFAGVIELDRGRVRLSLRNWKEMLALQQLRLQVDRVVGNFLANPNLSLSASDQRWLNLLSMALR